MNYYMRTFLLAAVLVAGCCTAAAQESHYRRAMRSARESEKFGFLKMNNSATSGITNGIYWSRVRDSDDADLTEESPADSVARAADFKRLCRLAYDAYEADDALHTIVYGDSALARRFHTPDLYLFMAISYERLGAYKEAGRTYKEAIGAGQPVASMAYKAFKKRQKQRQKEK